MTSITVDGPIKLKTALPDKSSLRTVALECYVTIGANQVCHGAKCPTIGEETDPEMACKVREEFEDICVEARLHLNTGALKFEYWRQCSTGQA